MAGNQIKYTDIFDFNQLKKLMQEATQLQSQFNAEVDSLNRILGQRKALLNDDLKQYANNLKFIADQEQNYYDKLKKTDAQVNENIQSQNQLTDAQKEYKNIVDVTFIVSDSRIVLF